MNGWGFYHKKTLNVITNEYTVLSNEYSVQTC